MAKSNLYEYNTIVVKQLGNKIKIIEVSCSRIPGFEIDKKHTPKYAANEVKLHNNVCRARTKVNEYALCNPWDYWCTFTISPEHYDRYNLHSYFRDLAEFIHNYNRRCLDEEKVKYLLVPEQHKDGAWHLHGFIKGIRKKDLYINSKGYLTWKQYEEKFGFISMSAIKNIDKASSYIYKYMTKDIARAVSELGSHLYYSSHGLKTADTIFRGHAKLHAEWDYEHPDGYCKIKTIDTRKEDLECILEVTQ